MLTIVEKATHKTKLLQVKPILREPRNRKQVVVLTRQHIGNIWLTKAFILKLEEQAKFTSAK